MTSRPPSKRFIDVLNINRTAGQRKQQLGNAMAGIPPEIMQTRFLRNRYLIDPKALCLLLGDTSVQDRLQRHHVFAIYKPPFCPMRRSDAGANFHHVSVESYLDAALRSNAIYPALTDLAVRSGAHFGGNASAPKADKDSAGIQLFETFQTQRLSELQKMSENNTASAAAGGESGPRSIHPGIHVRVLYDLDTYASGPVVVSLTDANRFARSLESAVMHYDVLVAGHLPLKGEEEITNIEDLYGEGEQTTTTTSATKTRCCWEATSLGYYAVHAVTVLRVSIFSPPSTAPPRIAEFVRKRLGTVVLGDPALMGETGSSKEAAATVSDSARSIAKPLNLSMDCDFSREFTHLRYVSLEADEYSSALSGGRSAGMDEAKTCKLEFQCRKCFDSIVKKERVYNLKVRRMGLLDGSWNPSTEHIG